MNLLNEYDVGKAFERIENELIKSMLRNLEHHKAEEEKEGFQWSQWQVEQLRALEEYKKANKTKFREEFTDINSSIDGLIRMARTEGNLDQEEEILKAIKNGAKLKKGKGDVSGEFFKVNDRKLDALIKATTDDFKRGEVSILRMANDQYRKIIFDAQVYANAGGTTYEKAVDMATKDFLSRGINCIEYSNGSRHTMAEYADMAIRTACKRAYLTGEGEKRAEWGVPTVIVNKRGNPCPKCLPFCGKVFIDDVWSGGSSDGISPITGIKYPLISEAIAAGLYHPRCRDAHTTYFEGINTPPDDKYTKKDLEDIEKENQKESRKQYAELQEKKFERRENFSLDNDNKKHYEGKKEKWEKEKKKLEDEKPRIGDNTDSAFSRERHGVVKERVSKMEGRIKELEDLRAESELKFLETLEDDAFKKAEEYAEKIDAVKEQLKPWKEELNHIQELRAKDAESHLKEIGVADKVKLSGKMTVEAVDVVEDTMVELIQQKGLPKLKGLEYNPVAIKLRSGQDVVAQYGWDENVMYLGEKLNDPIEFGKFRAKSEEAYHKRRADSLDKIYKKELEEAKEKLETETDKGRKYLLKKDINTAMSRLNPKRKAVPTSAKDVIIHEYGHHIHSLASRNEVPGQKYKIFGIKELKARMHLGKPVWQDNMIGKAAAGNVSDYATEDPLEAFAESFTAYMKGEEIPKDLKTAVEGAIKKVKPVAKQSGSDIIELTSEELGVIQKYKSFDSYTINDALRKVKEISELDPAHRRFVEQLDSVLAKMPKYEGDLIRTIDFSDWPDCEERTKIFAEEFIPGKKVKIRQYWSTSKKAGYNDAAGVKIYIQNAKMGRDISSIGLDEAEVLYERNQEFLVNDRVFLEGKWHILLEEV